MLTLFEIRRAKKCAILLYEMQKLLPSRALSLAALPPGYPDPMRQFLDCNEGFRRRVGRIIEFPDYTPRQIADIMMTKLAEKGSSFRGFQFAADCTPEAVAALIESGIPAEGRSKRNGGLAGTLLEYARERLDRRLNADHAENAELDELMTIQLKDLEAAVAQVASCASL